ncbi:MAG: phenylalanine--tRNA ligase subunit beta [Dehalococcoidia bacterium]|nr:phenylalanine--tRNA ligase subunit beta [Dehalococcoidia bacterium]
MRILLDWLRDYVDLTLAPDELCHRLTMAGLESSPADQGTILEIEVTPNRPDWLSILGIAWEAAALSGTRVRPPQVSYSESVPSIGEQVEISILDPDLCHRYSASLVRGVTVGPSPRWMQERLLAAGMRPISNIVDITNYVMLEYGQPLHAFDWRTLQAGKVLVRRARRGERLTTIDGVQRTLEPEMLVIADASNPIAVAGVMGGSDTEVSQNTTAVLLESANFLGPSVRRTSNKLNLRTEASIRFEKGISSELTLPALRRATQLFLEHAGGQASTGLMDIYPVREERPEIALTQSDLGLVLGVDWPLEQARGALIALGFDCREDGESLKVRSPIHRTDVKQMEDVIEEVARIVGYESIPTTTLRGALPGPKSDPLRSLEEDVRDIMVGYGLQDLVTYTMVSALSLERVRYGGPEPIRLANPMSREQEVLRPTLRSNMLSGLATNQRYGAESIWLFEVGRVFLPREGDLPDERRTVGAVLCGPHTERSWIEKPPEVDFFWAKGLVEGVLARLAVSASFESIDDPFFSPGRAAGVRAGGSLLGVVGELHPDVRQSFELAPHPVCYLELDLQNLLAQARGGVRFRELPRYPGVAQDLSIVVDQGVPNSRILEILQSFPLVREATVFDVFTGGQLAPDKKSLTYSLLYQSPDRTLTGEEASQVHGQIVDRLERELGATLRG